MFVAPSSVPSGEPGAMTSPAGIPNFLVEGLSIAEALGGVKTLRQAAPWLSRAGLHPWEDYNYKSSGADYWL